MYRLYFQSRSIIVTSDAEQTTTDPNAVILVNPEYSELKNLPYEFEKNEKIDNLYVITENEDSCFEQICSDLVKVEAGGGLVENSEGECLMIYRQGKWDLPKGKREECENINESAIREVKEECGVENIEIDSLICDTYHTYHMDGKFIVKDTKWYLMKYSGNGETTPQLAEDIEKAVWIRPEELSEYVNETYMSVQDVFLAHLKSRSDKILNYLKSLI